MKYPLTLIATLLLTALVALHAAEASKTQQLRTRVEMDLSGPGWSLWRDDKAEWKNDELFAPPVDLTKLPVNPCAVPTGDTVCVSEPPVPSAPCSRFEPRTSQTPRQYLQGMRLKEASSLLHHSKLTIDVIAEKTGFNDRQHLNLMFQKRFRITPAQFRKNALKL